MEVLVLTRYGRQGASTRLRALQYGPCLESAGIRCTISSLITDKQLLGRYRRGTYGPFDLIKSYSRRLVELGARRKFDLVWVEKELLPWIPVLVERWMLRGVPYVIDYDDAIFHSYDRHRLTWVRWCFGRKIDHLMAGARLVIAGNEYIAKRSREAGASRTEIIPTVVDLQRYSRSREEPARAGQLIIAWIGSPSTTKYLEGLRGPLVELARSMDFVLRVIGVTGVEFPGVRVECVPWAEATEVQLLRTSHVGVMPLSDGYWEQGKCGYKLIQYMACALPVVASPVGVNRNIVTEDCGFLAENQSQWVDSLACLLVNPTLRSRLGERGRRRVEEEYSLHVQAPRLCQLLTSVVEAGR